MCKGTCTIKAATVTMSLDTYNTLLAARERAEKRTEFYISIGSRNADRYQELRGAVQAIADICPADDAARGYIGGLLRAALNPINS